jgi:hypothetical protein
MKRATVISSFGLLLCLSGCGGMTSNAASDSHHHTRYSGIGIYAPGKLWEAQVNAQAKANQDPALAKVGDDEQIIVVVDGKTGEVRECGNHSGYCASIQPWAKAVEGAPVKLLKHADEADAAAEPDSAVADGSDPKSMTAPKK